MNFDVTIIIPVYKAVAFAERAIRSAQEQTLSPREILIVDDCSPDDTHAVVTALTASDSRVRVLRTPHNGGPSLARNIGIEHATGNWIAVLDADDAYAPTRLAILAKLVQSDPTLDIVADDLAYYDAGAGIVTGSALGASNVPHSHVSLADYLAHTTADGQTLDWGLLKPIFRLSYLKDTGLRYPTAQRHGEDYSFMVSLLSNGARLQISPEPLYLYTQREGAVSQRRSDLTRTSIAYNALAANARSMMLVPQIAASPHLRALLARRIEGLSRLDDAHFFSTAIRRGDVIGLIRRTKSRPAFLKLVQKQIMTAIKRRLHRQ